MTTIEQLCAERASMPDPLDVPPRQLADYEAKADTLDARILTIQIAQSILAEVDPLLATYTKWRDHLVSWRKTLCDELLACPAIKQRGLELSIQRIDWGLDFVNEMLPANLPLDDLMREAGYVPRDAVARANGEAWLGSMPAVEERLKALQARHDDARERLDAALAETN
jgi:hypothetical protein